MLAFGSRKFPSSTSQRYKFTKHAGTEPDQHVTIVCSTVHGYSLTGHIVCTHNPTYNVKQSTGEQNIYITDISSFPRGTIKLNHTDLCSTVSNLQFLSALKISLYH
jgi:hypothetical protein